VQRFTPDTARLGRIVRRASLGATATLAMLWLCTGMAGANPSAAQIDAFLAEHQSPMTGTGAVFAAEGTAHGVDPAFLVAIAGAESSFGRHLYSKDGDVCTFNAFNWFYGPTWPESDFGSWPEAIARVAEGLTGSLYYGAGLCSVESIAPRYCPDGTANWIANVTAFMTALGGDPADTRVDLQDRPLNPQPGLVRLNGSVELSQGERVVGEFVTVRFSIVNRGDVPLAVDRIRLAVRGPSASNRDFLSDRRLTLLPGEAQLVEASWRLDLVGLWHGWIEVEQAGQTSLVGKPRAFAYRVSLPPAMQLRQSATRTNTVERLP
jgi:hypothetical protein